MKHLYISLAALLTSVFGGAQAADLYLLTSISSEKSTNQTFKYDDEHRVSEAVLINKEDPSLSTRRVFAYDADGRVSVETTYQDLQVTGDPEQFQLVGQIKFVYNADGTVDKREVYGSYMSPGSEPVLESTYNYVYADNELSEVRVTVPIEGSEPKQIQRSTYQYDEEGRVVRKENYQSAIGSESLLTVTTYVYGGIDGRISRQTDYSYDFSSNRLSISVSTDYLYYEDGAIKSIDEYNSDRTMLVQQKVYGYNEGFEMSEAVYPVNYDDSFYGAQTPAYEITSMPISSYELRAFNEFSGKTELADIFVYDYTQIEVDDPDEPNDPSAIKSIIADDAAPAVYFDLYGRRVANPASGTIVIKQSGNAAERIYVK